MKSKLFIVIALLVGFTAANAQGKSAAKSKNANVAKVMYHISNMHGDHCKQIIEKKLPFERGVKDLVFDLEGQNLTIVYQSQRTTPENLQKALEKMGYEVKAINEKSTTAKGDKKECTKDGKKECKADSKKECSKDDDKATAEKRKRERERSCCRS